MLNMNNYRVPEKIPVIQLDQVEINQQTADYCQLTSTGEVDYKFQGVARFHNYPLLLELPHDNNHLTFHFSAVDWTASHKITYSYKMEGINDHWSIPGPEAKADYRGLPYGTYTFKVRAIGGAQKWSESFEYNFIINPPWWHTWWVRAGYGLLTLLIVFGIVRLRTAKLEQRQKELETEVFQATQKIREQKEEVETQRDDIEVHKEEIEAQRDEVLSINIALEKQKNELELTLENLKLTQSQLMQSEKLASVGVLTAGIAHELNNPINFVKGNVNPLRRDMDDIFSIIEKYDAVIVKNRLKEAFGEVDALKDLLDYTFLIKEIISLMEGIEEGANRSSQIVKGLRSFSRLDEEKCQSSDIHEGIDSTLILLQNKLKERITVRKEYGDFREVECFPSKLNQVFMNILTNSIQSIDGKGEILIQTISSDLGIKLIFKTMGKA